MKIIDLLNKIANGEEIPKKIKYDGVEYEEEPCYMLYEATGNCNESQVKDLLNDEVEIIEEDKKMEKIDIDSILLGGKEVNKEFGKKINELIDKVNSLENKQ